ncbi:MAG: hypothetical protein F6K11_02705 [Leptolyngbya sp. SIO3F4]|nr:hypothetical protein [Leptolyngbya sp. SIO3F4]
MGLTIASFKVFDRFQKDQISNKSEVTKTERIYSVLEKFFEALNNKNYEVAYKFTNNAAWMPPRSTLGEVNDWSTFEQKIKDWSMLKVLDTNGKTEPSDFGADTVLFVKYLGTDNNTEQGRIDTLVYNFHLKRIDEDWKIVRITTPMKKG